MLDPQDRALLLESLRPPDGYSLDRAIGTSYSLDLLALLAVPLAFTFFDWEDEQGQPTSDPLLLLEAVRRHAGRIRLFCQAGEIKVPKANQRLIGYLEKSVIAVKAPLGGVFHPKVWALRYVAPNRPIRYRLLCLSRNLTFDMSWDTVLLLDGELTDRQRGYGENRPLGEFFNALPGLAIHPLSQEEQDWIRVMALELRRVVFELPPDVQQLGFWPLGITAPDQRPFSDRNKRTLIMSPFLSPEFLEELVEGRPDCILISRPDQLSALPRSTVKKFKQIFALDQAAEELQSDDGDGEPDLAGLHAKLFVEDDGWDARIYTGSANATSAAFSRNVEFLVELIAKKSRLGIDTMLAEDGSGTSLRSLLRPWVAPSELTGEKDSDERKLEQRLSDLRRLIAEMRLTLALDEKEGLYQARLLSSENPPWPAKVEAVAWLSSLKPDTRQTIDGKNPILATFSSLGLDAVTSFIAFEVRARVGKAEGACKFVVCLPMSGAPADRMDRLLASLLRDKDQVRRLLWLLLQSQQDATLGQVGPVMPLESSGSRFNTLDGYPLFEQLVRAMADQDGTLGDFGRLVDDLARTPEGRAVLPEGFLSLWECIRAVMEMPSAAPRST